MVEEHVMASVQSRIDTNRVWQALSSVDDPTPLYPRHRATLTTTARSRTSTTPTTSSSTPTTLSKATDLLYQHEMDPQQQQQQRPAAAASRYQISLAAAIVCGIASNVVLLGHHTILSLLIAIAAFLTAYLDDDDDNDNSSSLTAALVRILGRTTIRSVRASEPKIKAVARVVLTGQEEVAELQRTIRQLQDENDNLQRENDDLRQWQTTHTYMYDTLWPRYTLVQLKDRCQRYELPVSGTKVELIQRLLDAGWWEEGVQRE